MNFIRTSTDRPVQQISKPIEIANDSSRVAPSPFPVPETADETTAMSGATGA